MKNYEEKYEPKSLAEMAIHDPNNEIMPLLSRVATGEHNPNILLYGANGTGKTTLSKVLTSQYYGTHGEQDNTHFVQMAFEKDSRQYERDKTLFHWSTSGVSWHILDEVDKCTHKNVYNELHHTLDNKHGHRYILTANQIVNIPQGILSRARPLPIDCPTPAEFLPRAQHILQQEGVEVPDAKVLAVLTAAGRDLRRYYGALELL